ncbi:MAG: N-formylglutamate amidohydrolase [Bdellovibrionaceae bacterium]|nr:N-formylglutamate amidohydrolase [Pseudobdellovibrionaceae bacterium]
MSPAMKPFFLSIPHSGERVPSEAKWLQGLSEPILMCDVDRFVDRLYSPVVEDLRLTCVKTQWHRYVVDLNRLAEDVDQDSVIGSPNASGKFSTGLHWVKTTRGTTLMAEPISQALHQQLVQRYFEPFHSDVRDTYEFFREHGASKIYHLDAHSMPSKGTAAHRDPGETRADIVVSDWEGKSCEPSFKDLVIAAYEKTGLKVRYNWPYLGGRVTQTYGQPDRGQHAIQVEINRALYMDEETKQFKPEPGRILSEKLSQAIRSICEQLPEIK